MTREQKRLSVIGGALAFLGAAPGLTFYALGQKASYFYMPADLQAETCRTGPAHKARRSAREGHHHARAGHEVGFAVTDMESSVKAGILPDLFREEQGVITEGSFRPDGVFVADSVLAKHDETYMPKEVSEQPSGKACGRRTE